MNISDLFREYARCIDMCEGTNVKPWHCVKDLHCEHTKFNDHPLLLCNPKGYGFTLSIVEDRPVFIGDELYFNIETHIKAKILDCDTRTGDISYSFKDGNGFGNISQLSWNPPKPKTFNLNGFELPLPFKKPTENCSVFQACGNFYYFNNNEDMEKVFKAITALLSGSS